MKVDIYEFEFDDGLYLNFKNIKKSDYLAKIIEKSKIAELIEKVVGLISIIRIYKKNEFEFELINHEDLGICLRLPVERDRSQDKEDYKLLRNIGKQIVKIINSK